MAITDRRAGVTEGLAIKAPCYVASTTNLILGSTQVIDGIAIGATGERILVKNQTDQKENGIYIASGASWSRARDCDGKRDIIPGTLVYVDRGTSYADTFWVFNSSSTATSISISDSTGDNIVLTEITPTLTDASGASVKATGTLTSRTLGDRFADVVNVKDFGAKGDGFTNDASAFATAVAATTDGEVVVIHVPSGEYAGAIWSISVGSRRVVWLEEGDVTYQAGPPPGSRAFTSWNSDKARPWLVGGWGAAIDDTDADITLPTFDVRRNTNHTSGGGYGVVRSAFSVAHNVLTDVDNFENAMTAVLEDRVVQSTNINFVGMQIEARRLSAALGSKANLFGMNIVVKDQTSANSTDSGGAVVGTEINVVASSTDTGNKRILLDLIPKIHNSTGTATFFSAIRIKPSTTGGTPIVNTAIRIEPGGGTISRGMYIEATSEALYITGTPSNASIETQVTNAGALRLGSFRSTAGSIVGEVQFSGAASASTTAKISWGMVRGIISNASSSTGDGRIDLLIPIGGTDTAVMRFDGVTPSNPAQIYVNGAMSNITVGTTDTGGSGFRVLRVPN